MKIIAENKTIDNIITISKVINGIIFKDLSKVYIAKYKNEKETDSAFRDIIEKIKRKEEEIFIHSFLEEKE